MPASSRRVAAPAALPAAVSVSVAVAAATAWRVVETAATVYEGRRPVVGNVRRRGRSGLEQLRRRRRRRRVGEDARRRDDGAEAVGEVEHAAGLGAVELADLVGGELRRAGAGS